MKLPFILIVDDDEQVLRAIQRDMRNKYRDEYRIVANSSALETLSLLRELRLRNESVAMMISDQRMPEMDGITFLENAKTIYDDARLVLLTAYSDIEAAIKAINHIKLDYYLLKPWSPPEEKLYPVVNDLLDDWQALFKPGHDGIRVLGYQWSPKSHKLKEFLSGNLLPFLWMDIENSEDAEKYLSSTGLSRSDLPVVLFTDGSFLSDPSLTELAAKAGLKQKAERRYYDVVIIGAGPSGLAASVYGASEGLKTLLIEKSNPGGQASSSARIENYLGFPSGLSGAELSRRAITQAVRFGTEILTPQEVQNIRVEEGYKLITLSDGSEISSRSVVIATGVAYRMLSIPGIEKFTGAGVYYGSAAVEAHACKNEVIYIVGGGNSACQAAMYMCNFAREVHILIRQESMHKTAANYLVEQIEATPNIIVHTHCDVTGVSGETVLESITVKNSETGAVSVLPSKALFVYIGAKPGTELLKDLVMKDDKGFIITGRELVREKSFQALWKLDREPFLSETSIPGIFASGDVRFGAMAGISAAVAEGAMAIRFVRKYLQEN